MSIDIKPKYEILFSDLKNHLIGDYLISREFKMFMSKNEFYESWNETYEKIKDKRNYISIGFDHNRADNIDTLAAYLNVIHEVGGIEEIITSIIVDFMNFKKTNEDFNDIIESCTVANFDKKNILKIKNAFEIHRKKSLPNKEVKNKEIIKTNTTKDKENVFIVHGHNEELKEKVARTLEKLKLKPIILHEQTNEGLTIIEKFEKHSNVDFAVVLLTYDDFGNVKSSNEKNKRSRQNVILELGYFIGKLGRNKVMPLYEKEVELPSDIAGVIYTIIDDSENWKIRLVKELKASGYKVDANDIL